MIQNHFIENERFIALRDFCSKAVAVNELLLIKEDGSLVTIDVSYDGDGILSAVQEKSTHGQKMIA